MKHAHLDGRQRSRRAVLRKLARDLEFPDHFGENLDALYDMLTTDITGPIHVSWRSTPASRILIGRDYQRLVDTLEAAAAERQDLSIDLA